MTHLYIAGPVLPRVPSLRLRVFEPFRKTRLVDNFYEMLKDELKIHDLSAFMPTRDPKIDDLRETAFTQMMIDRLSQSSGLISYIEDGDQSAPVEAAYGAALKIPQIIVAETIENVPRILLGLPYVVDAFSLVPDQLHRQVRQAINKLSFGKDAFPG